MLTLEECQELIEREHEWETSKLYRPIEESLILRTFKEAPVSVLVEHHPEILKEIITKYEVGEFCSWHRDSAWNDVKQGYHACAVWITPLNDDYEGGDLYFNNAPAEQEVGKTIKHSTRSPHQITEVTKGTRYSLVSWVFRKA
jgi:predicted 2-oxoglutarate/Fe(II)-dependent dioxygenase YbiX